MNNLKLISILLKLMLIVAISTASAQTITWDEPTDCDRNNKRSINVWVKNVEAGLYRIIARKGKKIIHTGNEYRVKEYEFQKKRIILGSIPPGTYTLYLERDKKMVRTKDVTFNPCPDEFEDTIVWGDGVAINCNGGLFNRTISVEVTNNSNEEYKYELELDFGNKTSSAYADIAPGENKKLSIETMDISLATARLKRGSEIIGKKIYRYRKCGENAPPDEVEWAHSPGNCDQYKKRSIEAMVTNNSDKQKFYDIKVYKQNNNHHGENSKTVHEVSNIPIAAKSKKSISLGGIPSGYFRVQILSGDDIIGSSNYIFENCDISANEINKLTQVKNFEPFFTKLEQPFSINLSNYFKSNECNTITYSFKKLSPGITHQLSGNVLSIRPTNSFLGKSLLEITATCGNKTIVENITINTQLPNNLLHKYNLRVVNVAVLNFDPVMTNYQNKLLHETFNWRDPMEISEQYVDSMTVASGNYIYFNIVEWSYFNEFPVQNDGTQLTPTTYTDHYVNQFVDFETIIDYPKIVQEYGMVDLVNQKEVDEVWFSVGSVFGVHETSMLGPYAFNVNGISYDQVESDRSFVMLTLPYARTVTEMMHNNGHRAERIMTRVYNEKQNWEGDLNNWERFTANEYKTNGGFTSYGVGTIHFPFNGIAEGEECAPGRNCHICGYDYDNANPINSYALDFANYPNISFDEGIKAKPINAQQWGNTQVGYLKFWYSLLPKVEGINADGRQNNWWKYIYDFNRYNKSGKSINKGFEKQSMIGSQYLTEGMGNVFLFDLDDYFIDTDVALPQFRAGLYQNGINLWVKGSKVYAHIPQNSAGSYTCFVKAIDEDYRSLNFFTIYVDEAGAFKIGNATTLDSNNFPNPFSQQTTITYTLPQSSNVSIKVYNSAGKQIEVLSDNIKQMAGTHQINFNGSNYPSGIYYYSIQNGEHFKMHKMVLMNRQ